MIVDQFYPGGSEKPHVYTRYRNEDGMLIEHIDSGFKPYFWISEDAPDWQVRNALKRYPGSKLTDEKAKGLHGENLRKMETHTPKDCYDMKGMFDRSWEADVRFPDRYLIDNHHEMPKWTPRKWWYDIECDTTTGATTVFAIVGNTLDTPQVYAWADETTNCPYTDNNTGSTNWEGALSEGTKPYITREVRGIEYHLHLFSNEVAMQEAIIRFMQKGDPDMLIAHGGAFFDLPHMITRFPKPERLSPVGVVRRPKKGDTHYVQRNGMTNYTVQPIVGRWCFDTAAPAASGSGFERVWKDSGKGQLPSRKLNDIAEMLGLGSKLTEEIEGMDVHNGWREYWPEFVDYCLLDAVLLKEIDRSQNVTDFFVEMVRLCGVTLESACNVSHFGRGLLSRRTSKKAPSRVKSEHGELKGAEVGLEFVRGRHQGVGIFDFKGLYPSLILGNNLSYETKRHAPGPGIKRMDNGTYWDQTKKGLLPQVITYLFDYRAECKANAVDPDLTSAERGAWRTTEKAVKRVMASLYGMTAHTGFGWADADIATTITSEGRRAIHMLSKYAGYKGYPTLYGHTDSAFVQVPRDEADTLAKYLSEKIQEDTGNDKLIVELEEWMPYWLLVAKNRYVGRTEDGGMKVAGFELKASSASGLSKSVQETAFNLIVDGADEVAVTKSMREIVNDVKNGDIEFDDVCQRTRLGMGLHEYKTLSGASRAAKYYNDHLATDEPFGRGDSVPWVYVKGVPANLPDTDIVAYRDASDLEGFTLDVDTVIKKGVTAKIKSAYDTLGWDLDAASGAAIPKKYW